MKRAVVILQHEGSGSLWLKNGNGVVLEINTRNEDLVRTTTTEGVLIRW